MCGIMGQTGQAADSFEAAFAALGHRGPDGRRVEKGGAVNLAHCRLAIIDVSDRGLQPMKNEKGDVAIVFNGEIYNYKKLRVELEVGGAVFSTETDTEVIIKGYEKEGTDFFSRLRGMWAFALHDTERGVIVLSRDYFGIKPLLYSTHTGELTFASEMRAMKKLISPLSPNTNSYFQFFNLGYFAEGDTCYGEVKRLLPGEIATWNVHNKTLTTTRLTFPQTPETDETFERALLRIESALTNSVEAHFVSDVPVGLLLSGGNDSSLIAALAVHSGRKPIAYTLEIEGSIDAPYAQKVAVHLGLPHERVEMTKEMFRESYAGIWDLLDEPFADSSIIPTSLIYRAMKGRTKVVLSGEGGDELFGGYTRHRQFASLRHIRKGGAAEWVFSLYGASRPALSSFNPALSRLRRILEQSSGDLLGTYLSQVRTMDFPIANKKLREFLFDVYAKNQYTALANPSNLFFDRALYLPYDLLYKTDIASMASSIEARVPFLDREVMSALASVKSRYALSPQYMEKMILKRIAEKHLPSNLVYRPKKGFGFSHERYVSTEFTRDVGLALDFHRAHAHDFGLVRENIRHAMQAKNAELLIAKYPAFAFALVSNWKVFK